MPTHSNVGANSTSMDVTIAIDCMGGDHGPSVTLPAVFRFLQADQQAGVTLVGLAGEIETEVAKHKLRFGERLCFRPATEVVGMHDPVATPCASRRTLLCGWLSIW